MNREFQILILGSSSATPTKSRHHSSQLVVAGDHVLLIDCGEGTQYQMLHYGVRHSRIDTILISHLHGDHYYGLPGLLGTMSLGHREKPITIIGPPRIKEFVNLCFELGSVKCNFPIHYIETDPQQPSTVWESDTLGIDTIPLDHRIPTTGFVLREKYPELKLDRVACDIRGIPQEWYERLKQGEDYRNGDQVIPYSELTTPGRRNRRYAYISHTLYKPAIAELISGCELLYHEATFLEDMAERAEQTFHSTASQAARFALLADAGKLIIGHFSARYKLTDWHLEEAKRIFPNSECATEGRIYSVEHRLSEATH